MGKTTGQEEVRRSTRRSPPWCVAMGAGQGHGRDRLSSLREKMYGYRMPLPDSARLCAASDSQRDAVEWGIRHPIRFLSFSCPFLFRACAALRLPSLVWNNGGIGQARNGVRWFGGIKNRMVVEQKRKHTNFAQTARFSSRKYAEDLLTFYHSGRYVYVLTRVSLISFTEIFWRGCRFFGSTDKNCKETS